MLAGSSSVESGGGAVGAAAESVATVTTIARDVATNGRPRRSTVSSIVLGVPRATRASGRCVARGRAGDATSARVSRALHLFAQRRHVGRDRLAGVEERLAERGVEPLACGEAGQTVRVLLEPLCRLLEPLLRLLEVA